MLSPAPRAPRAPLHDVESSADWLGVAGGGAGRGLVKILGPARETPYLNLYALRVSQGAKHRIHEKIDSAIAS